MIQYLKNLWTNYVLWFIDRHFDKVDRQKLRTTFEFRLADLGFYPVEHFNILTRSLSKQYFHVVKLSMQSSVYDEFKALMSPKAKLPAPLLSDVKDADGNSIHPSWKVVRSQLNLDFYEQYQTIQRVAEHDFVNDLDYEKIHSYLESMEAFKIEMINLLLLYSRWYLEAIKNGKEDLTIETNDSVFTFRTEINPNTCLKAVYGSKDFFAIEHLENINKNLEALWQTTGYRWGYSTAQVIKNQL